MQNPDVPKLLGRCAAHGAAAQPMTTTYYLGRQTLLTGDWDGSRAGASSCSRS
jgi:K+ transporter